jgi:hypothetical protein
MTAYLKAAAAALRAGHGAPAIFPVQAALQAYAANVATLRSEGATRGVAAEAVECFFALGFSLEQMQQNLRDLERCVSDWADPSATDAETIDPDRSAT